MEDRNLKLWFLCFVCLFALAVSSPVISSMDFTTNVIRNGYSNSNGVGVSM
jgi:hypothetical protein